MMSEDQFWGLIDERRFATKTFKESPEWLEQRLIELPANDILDFRAWLGAFAGRLYDAKLWAAASIIHHGLSYDGFFGFQGWLIAQGKVIYENTVVNPDSLADLEFAENDVNGPITSLENLFYTYFQAYNKKFGRPSHTTVELPPGYQNPSRSQPSPPAGTTMQAIHEQVDRELTIWLSDQAKLEAAFPK